MSSLLALFIIVLTVLVDYFYFDVDKKRWGWMKNWSTLHKGLFFSELIIDSVAIYLGLSTEFLS